MLTATVNVNLPGITGLQSLLADNRKLMQAAGKGVEVCLRRHFLELDQQGNKQGWPRKHFWSRTVRQATSLGAVTRTSATVCIASPEFGLHLRGGTVRPKRGKFLAIPITDEAYKAGSPREGNMPGLFTVRFPKGNRMYLATKDGMQYRLVKSATIPADPRALPPEADLAEAARVPVEAMLNRAIRRRR
jgi:hypothetical protein